MRQEEIHYRGGTILIAELATTIGKRWHVSWTLPDEEESVNRTVYSRDEAIAIAKARINQSIEAGGA